MSRVEPRAGADCDGLLKDQLVVQRTASNAERMQFLISQIQGRRDECSMELWDPVVRDRPGRPLGCNFPVIPGVPDPEVGGVRVPDGLKTSGGTSVFSKSSRDVDNNIIVYWVHPDDSVAPKRGLPSDGSVCWLHVAAFGAWTEEYCQEGGCAP